MSAASDKFPVSSIPTHWAAHDSAELEHPAPKGWLKGAYAIAEALFSAPEGPPNERRLRWLCAELGDFVARIGPKPRFLYRFAVFAVIWIAPLWVLRPLPGKWGSVERRIRLYNRIERSTLGPALLAVKAIMCILYYEHPEAAKEIGFDGQCLKRTPNTAPETGGPQ